MSLLNRGCFALGNRLTGWLVEESRDGHGLDHELRVRVSVLGNICRQGGPEGLVLGTELFNQYPRVFQTSVGLVCVR